MGKTVALQGPEAAFCRRIFGEYYLRARIPAPLELAQREYAFAPFEEGSPKGFASFLRHRAIRDGEELHRTLTGIVPRHAYYSTSLYEAPDHPTMKEKGWLGADVVFDLDADHLREAEHLSYPRQLELARDRFRYLLDEFIFGDFGLREPEVTLTFSGGRGYHAHIHADGFRRLSGGERRELVDYIMGTGFDPLQDTFREDVQGKVEGVRTTGRTYRRIFAPTDPGWRGRISRGVHHWIEVRKNLDVDAMTVEVQGLLAGQHPPAGENRQEVKSTPAQLSREARTIAKDLVRPETQRAILDHQSLEAFPHDKSGEKVKEFLDAMVKVLAVDLQGEMDAPVTTDIHRLIRMPGSLHGGTGFVVQPISRAELERFDPFSSALLPRERYAKASSFGEGRTQVTLAAGVDYPFPGEGVHGRTGETLSVEVPEALFLLLRGEASLKGEGK